MFYTNIVKLIQDVPDNHTSTQVRALSTNFVGTEQEAYDLLCHIFDEYPPQEEGGYVRLLASVKRFFVRPGH